MASRMQFAGRYKVVDTQTLRVKLARRKSLTQKENRHHEFGKSRDLRLMDPNTSVLKGLQAMEELSETSLTQCHENSAVLRETGSKARGERSQQRQEMLWRYKEEKLLRKLKEQREKAQKSVFRCGIYRPDADLPTLPSVRNVAKTKDKQPAPTTRVTRSAARAEAPPSKTTRRQPVGAGNSYIRASEPTTRGHRQGQATKMAEKENHGFPPARTTRATAPRVLTKNTNVAVKPQKKTSKDPKSQEIPPETKAGSRILVEEHKAGEVSNKSASDPPEPPRERIVSFAPENFTFKPLDGLCSYRLQPMTPGTADKFLSFTWSPVRAPSGNAAEAPEDAIEVCEAEVRLPSFHGVTSPACPPPTETTQECNVLPQHDVPYFRGALRSEIQRLTSLCAQWDERFGMAIPDDAKDLIRTTVGQTRLLMGERFKQFEGLVDNCEFKRGEKETTCTDLDGFWDMVYFQIEDVVKKFANLGKLEENSWQQNTVQPEKAVKKRSASVAKPNPGDQARVAARSRLAAIKAAMKKGRVPEEVAGAAAAEPVVFDAGFFRVESPAKQPSGVKAKRSSLQASTLCRSPMRTPPAAPSSGFADGGLWVTPGVNPPVGRTLFGDAEEDRLNESEPREKSPHLLGNESHLDLVKYLVPPEECNLSFGPPKSFNLVTGSQGETSIHAHILSDGEIEDEVFTCDSKRTEQQMDVITSLAEERAPAAQTLACPGRRPPSDMVPLTPQTSDAVPAAGDLMVFSPLGE